MKLVFDKPDSSGGYTPTYISLAETQGVSEHGKIVNITTIKCKQA